MFTNNIAQVSVFLILSVNFTSSSLYDSRDRDVYNIAKLFRDSKEKYW